MEKKFNTKKIILSVVLIALIVFPFALIPCSAVDVHGRYDYPMTYVPTEVWIQNQDNVFVGTDFKIANGQGTFGNNNFYTQYTEFNTDGTITNVVVPYANNITGLVGVNYNHVGYNVNYTTNVTYLNNKFGSYEVEGIDDIYSYDIYQYSLFPKATYVDGNTVYNRFMGENIKRLEMRGGGFAVNLFAMQTTGADEQSILNTNVHIDATYNGTVRIISTVTFRDIQGNFYERTYYNDVEILNEGSYYAYALDNLGMYEDIKVELGEDISPDDCYVYVEDFNTSVFYAGQDFDLGIIQVNTCYSKNLHSSQYESVAYNEKFNNYLVQLKADASDGDNNGDAGIADINLVQWLANCVSSVLTIELAYGITFGGIVAIIIGFGTLMWFLKLYGGG